MLMSIQRRSMFFLGFFLATSSMLTAKEIKKEPPPVKAGLVHEKSQPRKYTTFNYPAENPGGNTLLTGIRRTDLDEEIVYISGFYECPNNACVTTFVYKGPLSGTGSWNVLNYPSSTGVTVKATNLYGPNDGKNNTIQVVGNYTTEETGSSTIGCLYEGPLNGSGLWTTLIPTSTSPVINTIAHSTNGGLVVGNYDTQLDEGKAFIYDIKTKKYNEITKSNALSITAYGIWYNGKNSYTIAGSYSDANYITGLTTAYLVDWNKKTKKLTNWRNFSYGNNPAKAIVTHFDGITSDRDGGYYLTGDWLGIGGGDELAFFAHVPRGKTAKWAPISFPPNQITSGNSVYRKVVIGVYTEHIAQQDDVINGYISIPE